MENLLGGAVGAIGATFGALTAWEYGGGWSWYIFDLVYLKICCQKGRKQNKEKQWLLCVYTLYM